MLAAVQELLRLALNLDVGHVHSSTVQIILYIVRLAVRVESVAAFLVDYALKQHETMFAELREVVF